MPTPFVQLDSVKARVGISLADTTKDTELTLLIGAVEKRFESACRRGLRVNPSAIDEFRADERTVVLEYYPLRTITTIEIKDSEAAGWVQVPSPEYLVTRKCMVTFSEPLGSYKQMARIRYAGGYAVPGDTVRIEEGYPVLPDGLQWAALEQAAHWWLWKDKVGLWRHAVAGGLEVEIRPAELLPHVTGILRRFERYRM